MRKNPEGQKVKLRNIWRPLLVGGGSGNKPSNNCNNCETNGRNVEVEKPVKMFRLH